MKHRFGIFKTPFINEITYETLIMLESGHRLKGVCMKKGKDFEADYFNRENTASKHRLAESKRRQQKKAEDNELKALHYMKCPKCGHDLVTKRLTYMDVDQCSSCGVLVIESADIDRFIAEEKSILKTFIDFFKS